MHPDWKASSPGEPFPSVIISIQKLSSLRERAAQVHHGGNEDGVSIDAIDDSEGESGQQVATVVVFEDDRGIGMVSNVEQARPKGLDECLAQSLHLVFIVFGCRLDFPLGR